jgi:hypothetical protein
MGFERYLQEQCKRFSTVKTIISSSTPVPFLDIYVNLHLAQNGRALRDDDFLNQISRLRNVLFAATAGAGKSMLMRYLYLRFIEVQSHRLPVFIDLRELNLPNSSTIVDAVRSKIADYIDNFSLHQLRYAFETGSVILFLDGFDEIDHDKRKAREREINDLVSRYSELWTFMSSRPSDNFASWEKFHVYRVRPFSKKQVEQLIAKIPYDPEVKAIFTKKMSEGLYESHSEFLANPLLTVMMLITLEHFAEVPAKVHLFYEYAFEALFGRHDVTKGGFQRKRHTSLALDDFKRLFAYFCTITYLKDLTTFSSESVLQFIQQSINSSQIEVDKVHYKNDLTESTCMLAADGLDYTFNHRSFQEYFTAYFLSRVKADEFQRALPKIVQRGRFDNVLKMVSEMSKEKFEEAWALPTLRLLCDRVKGVNAQRNCVRFAQRMFGVRPHIMFRGPESEDIMIAFFDTQEPPKNDDASHLRFALYRTFDLFDRIQEACGKGSGGDAQMIEDIRMGRILKDDARFDIVRDSCASMREKGTYRIELKESDSKWLANYHFAQFMYAESLLLPKLRDEVAHRVSQRKKGLAQIFPS